MNRPSDVSPEIYERAEILCDQFRHIEDDRELIARVLIAVGQGAEITGITHEQARVLNFVRQYQSKHNGVSPSYAEIGREIGRSRGNVHDILHRLQDRGILSVPARRARAITIVERA